MSPPPENTASAGPTAQGLPDDQARAQVVDAARDIARAANLRVTYATFEWEWCNDQGEPPYHGRVDVAYEVPQGTDSATMAKQVAATAAQQPGWAPGPPPGLNPYGEVVHKGGVMAIASVGNYPERGSLQIFGECRNMTDHRDDSALKDITGEVKNR
ncbi:MAG: hypothetical protein PGN37_14445 [Mycobacterium kyogaense]|uniref:hypothetical protein n=1 Tax=Mycobacterium kyogaense TaxID=2212479 RepID=UPI002FF63FDC